MLLWFTLVSKYGMMIGSINWEYCEQMQRKIMKMKRMIVLATVAVIATGCFQGNNSEIGPRETLETFYRSLCSGEFDTAETLCSEAEMDEFLTTFRTAWKQNDSTITAIASDILSELSVNVTAEKKDGQTRTIFYELTTTDGQNKEKIATLPDF